jgi:predicted amidohydrolase
MGFNNSARDSNAGERRMRMGVVQLTSTDDLDANLDAAAAGIDEAVARGAEFVALPESFAFLRREGLVFPCAQSLDDRIVGFAREIAAKHGIWLLAGSFPEAIAESERVHNTSTLLSPDGELAAVYRKIHLFDVDLGESGGGAFRESDTCAPGSELVTVETPFGIIGLSICYDLRFPEMYRLMADAGVHWIVVPSAFSPHTGKDHWEVLLRARAIENQAFVIAPAQCGAHSESRASYGRSMIIDPWGIVLAQGADRPCVLVADCDMDSLLHTREAIPCLDNRRL